MSTLREALSNAFEKEEDEVDSGAPSPAESSASAPEVSLPPSSEGVSQEPKADGAPSLASDGEGAPKSAEEPSPTVDAKLERPPGSWKPAVREKWATVDPDVRAEIQRREAEMSRGLNQVTVDAKYGKELRDICAPFAQSFRVAGVDEKTAITSLLETDASLRGGTPREKAQRVAEIINYYGVSVEVLGALLSGQNVEEAPQDPQIRQLMQRIAQLEGGYASVQERSAESVKGEVEEFSKDAANEFFRDVREDMIVLLDAGKAATLKEAYDKAVWANPDTRAVMLKRQTAELSASLTKTAHRAREASSSIAGSGEPVSNVVNPANLRAALEQAWDSAGDRL